MEARLRQSEALGRVLVDNIPVAVALVFALLYALFNNFTFCLLTLASVPFRTLVTASPA